MDEQGLLENAKFSNVRKITEVVRQNAFWASVTVGTAVASCTFQVTRFAESIQGVLVIWPIIGLAFAIIKSGMFGIQWQRLTHSTVSSDELFKKRGKILFNVAGLATLMLTNSILLITLLSKGIDVWHWTTYATLVLTIGSGIIWYFNRHRSSDRQLLIIGTGINIIPTYLQGASYVFRGANGMPFGSVAILLVMAYAMYRQSLPVYKGETAALRRQQLKQALKEGKHPEVLLPKWDLICQIVAFGACWGIATFILPFVGLSWWPLA